MAEAQETLPIVIDTGSYSIKAGYAGEEAPQVRIRSVVGRIKQRSPGSNQGVYVGTDALTTSEPVAMEYPIQHGIITKFEEAEKLWSYAFNSGLQVDPAGYRILLALPPNTHSNYEKIAQIMFETYNVASLCLANPAILSFVTTCRSTGILWECGDGVSQIVPVQDMEPIRSAMSLEHFAGRNITSYFAQLLSMQGSHFMTTAEREIVRDMKNKQSYVALDYELELQKAEKTNSCKQPYELPDGSVLELDKTRFMAPELLFQPYLNGLEINPIHEQIYQAIMKCDMTIRKEMYSNVIISGGTSATKGLEHRLSKELTGLIPPSMKIKIIADKGRKVGSWIGGSIYSQLPDFDRHSSLRQDYQETGVQALISKGIY